MLENCIYNIKIGNKLIITNCFQCDGLKLANLDANSNATLDVTTKYPLHIYYVKNNQQFCK